ncbi:hypothetical protein [Paenibacillus sinopodophylli]|uniref:hypothetical protein n=1 Tax=Paenibacillus sinopodophylli TaxID=1837342 RepID=UPI00110CBDA8|nr:hypothetical protein [Paenibacillus sinopodophylli]
MTIDSKGPNRLLQLLEADYSAEGFQTGWTEPSVEDPFRSLIVLFDGVGEDSRDIQLELCFLTDMEDAEAAGICILQAFVTITEDVSSEFYEQLLLLIVKLNTVLPLGAFGLFADTGVVYFKHNSLLLLSNEDSSNVKAIDTQNGLILHLHQLYMEALLRVSAGHESAEQTLENLLL